MLNEPEKKFPYMVWACMGSAALLIMAPLFEWPYEFYQLLRLIICIVAGILTYQFHQESKKNWMISFLVIAILFNPLIPVHLKRGSWAIVDFITAGFFIAAFINACPDWKSKTLQFLEQCKRGW